MTPRFSDPTPLNSVEFVSAPASGTLTLTIGGNTNDVETGEMIPADELDGLTYSPFANFTGSDSFQWIASDDGSNFTDTPANVNITVSGPPTVSDIALTLNANSPHTFTAGDFNNVYVGTDPIADVDIDSLPSNGTLTLNGTTFAAGTDVPIADIGELVYTPTSNFLGIDAFQWNASDGNLISNTANVNFTINSDLADIAKTTFANTSVNFDSADFQGVYTGGDTVTSITVTSLPTDGTLALLQNSSLTAVTANQVISAADLGELVYKPNTDFIGSDTFSFTASDGSISSNGASADLKVNSYYTAFTKNVDTNVALNFSSSDFTGTFALTLQSLKVIRVPVHGTLLLTLTGKTTKVVEGRIIPVADLGDLSYKPAANFGGNDSIIWEATDGTGYKGPAGAVSIVVAAPIVVPFSESVGVGTPFNFQANDFSDQFAGAASMASIKVVSLPAHGTLTLGGAAVTVNETIPAATISSLTYTPVAGYTGADTFKWTASDGITFATPTAAVGLTVATLTVTGNSVSITSGEKSPVTTNFTDFATDADSDAPTLARTYVVTNLTNSTVNLTGGAHLIQVVGADAAEFTLTSPPVATLGPGQTTSFTISFLPVQAGVQKAALEIPYLTLGNSTENAPTFTFDVQGTGVNATVKETSQQLAASNNDNQVLMVASTKAGKGTGAVNGDIIYITYTGRLLNGTVFDQSSNHGNIPLEFRLDSTIPPGGNAGDYTTNSTANFDANTTANFPVIAGWENGLQGIKPGETRTLIIDSDFGYGAAGTTGIPGDSTLIFDVTCTAIDDAPSFGITDTSTGTEVLPGSKTPSTSNGTDFGMLPSGQTFIGDAFSGTNNNPTDATGTLLGSTVLNSSGTDNIKFEITGADPKDFIAEGTFDNFTLFFRPTAPGVRTATIHFITDDPHHRDFSFVVRGDSSPDVDLLFAAIGTKAISGDHGSGPANVKTTIPVVIENFGNSPVPSATPTTDLTITAVDTSNINATPVVIGSMTLNLSGFHGLSTKNVDVPVTIPASLAQADYVLNLEINGSMSIAESNVSNDSSTTSTDISGSLISTSIPANIVQSPQGVTGTVSVVITNTGEYTLASNESARVEIIAFNANASTSIDLGTQSVSIKGMGTGASHTFAIPVNFPAGLVAGSYQLEALVTPSPTMLESSVSNNSFTATSAGGTLTFSVGPPSADLSTSFSSGSPGKVTVSGTEMHMSVPVTITNVGNISVPSATPTTDVDVFLKNNADTTSALIPIGSIADAKLQGLAEGKSVTVDVPVALATSLTTGTFSYVVEVNNSNSIPELNKANNSATSSAGITGTLIVSSLPGTVTDAETSKGEVFVRLGNSGGLTLPSNQQVKVEVLLLNTSTNATTVISKGFTAESDKTWATSAGNDTFSFPVTVPKNMATGTYDVEVQLEYAPGLIQSVTPTTTIVDQNGTSSPIVLTVVHASADLKPTFSAASPGKVTVSGSTMSMTVPVTITNVGTLPVSTATPTTDVDITLVGSNSTMTAIGAIAHQKLGGLGVGKSVTVEVPVTIPTNMTLGTFTYEVQVNNSSAISETDTANNSATASAAIIGALITTSLPGTLSHSISATGAVDVAFKNSGGLTLPSNQDVKVEILLENTANNATTAISTGFVTISDKTWAAPAGTDTFAIKVTVPADMTPGTYDVEALVEYAPGIVESITPTTMLAVNAQNQPIVLTIS